MNPPPTTPTTFSLGTLIPYRFGVQGLDFRVDGVGFRTLGSKISVWGLGLRTLGLVLRV